MKTSKRIHRSVNNLRLSVKNNSNRFKKISSVIIGLATIISVLPIFSKGEFIDFDHLRESLSEYLSYYINIRLIVIYVIIIIIYLSKEFYKYEVQVLNYTLERKREIANKLSEIYKNQPKEHYIGLIIGKLGDKALKIKEQKSKTLITKIDANIKKHELVYWISKDELGIIIYETNEKDATFFMDAILDKKLNKELDGGDGKIFYDDTKFIMIKLNDKEELNDAEERARIAWDLKYNIKESGRE